MKYKLLLIGGLALAACHATPQYQTLITDSLKKKLAAPESLSITRIGEPQANYKTFYDTDEYKQLERRADSLTLAGDSKVALGAGSGTLSEKENYLVQSGHDYDEAHNTNVAISNREKNFKSTELKEWNVMAYYKANNANGQPTTDSTIFKLDVNKTRVVYVGHVNL